MSLNIFETTNDRLKRGVQGSFPSHLIEELKSKTQIRHSVDERLTRPWIRHFFIMRSLKDESAGDDTVLRDNNLLDIFKTAIPLAENSFSESSMSSWRLFLDTSFRDPETQWYNGIRKTLNHDRFYSAIEQLEIEMPASNPQRYLNFYDHHRTMRRIPRIPIKLFFSLPGNEKEKLIEILSRAVNNNPHNLDVALLAYAFFKAWDRTSDFLQLARTENRFDLEEWYFWAENDLMSVGLLRRDSRDYVTSFLIYDRATVTSSDFKEVADWFLKESEFKSAFHFYWRAKEFETAIELLQNISVREYAELTNLRRISRGEKPLELTGDNSRFASMYQEEMETVRGFARIRAAETYREVTVKARQHFDRETIETKYAFGELTEDEYGRLIRQIQERKQ